MANGPRSTVNGQRFTCQCVGHAEEDLELACGGLHGVRRVRVRFRDFNGTGLDRVGVGVRNEVQPQLHEGRLGGGERGKRSTAGFDHSGGGLGRGELRGVRGTVQPLLVGVGDLEG
jgi:hypothetical protein